MNYSETVFVTFNFQYIINDIGDIGDEQIIMFEEAGGVGAEEVVSSNEYDLCFVDTAAEVSWVLWYSVEKCVTIPFSSFWREGT